MPRQVQQSAELRRILALPRRDWTAGDYGERVAEQVTALLRRPQGTMRLFPQQAVALKEMWETGGAFVPLGVGEGKTLVSLLAPYVFASASALLLVPATLLKKTRNDMRDLAKHWLIPAHLQMCSYEALGRVNQKHFLERGQFDLIVTDECHKIKNLDAAVSRRVLLYAKARAAAKLPLRFVMMSGTMTNKSLRDYGHIAALSHRERSPVPLNYVDLEDWANCLDENGVNDWERVEPGALVRLLDPGEAPTLENVRRAFGRRLVQTPGVISSRNQRLGTSLIISHAPAVPSRPTPDGALSKRLRQLASDKPGQVACTGRVIDDALELLVKAWELPDGTELIDAKDVWRHARTITLGFYYIWDPPPPDEWRIARKAWGSFCRDKIGAKFHSPLDVANNFPDAPELLAWRAIRKTYDERKNIKPVWLCDSVINLCAAWLHEPRNREGILWTQTRAFPERLSERSGVPYYGRKGLDANGRYIEDANGPIIASISSNNAGRNLQKKWNKNFVVSFPSSATIAEQMLGRTHRTGQLADEVTCEVYFGGAEDVAAFWRRAVAQAYYQRDTMQQQYRLTYCDIALPSDEEMLGLPGPRWQR